MGFGVNVSSRERQMLMDYAIHLFIIDQETDLSSLTGNRLITEFDLSRQEEYEYCEEQMSLLMELANRLDDDMTARCLRCVEAKFLL